MTPATTHLCCPDCRLRFNPAATAHLGACPSCGEPLQASSLEGTLGFRLFRLDEVSRSLAQAVAESLLVPDLDGAGP
jgi:predicted amidophosphoribosyltransferase